MTKSEQKRIDQHYSKYRDNLLEALRYLSWSPLLNEFAEMRANCSVNLDRLSQAQKRENAKWVVNIEGWTIPILAKGAGGSLAEDTCGAPGEAKLLIEGRISTEDFPILKQSITVSIVFTASKDIRPSDGYDAPTVSKGEAIVVRRFHFDYDPTALDHPRSHVQYGGNFDRGGQVHQIRYELFEKPKEPRIPYPPYDIVLCLDLILRQFHTALSPIVDDKPWISYCRKSEKLLVQEYYSELCEHIKKFDADALHKRQLDKVGLL